MTKKLFEGQTNHPLSQEEMQEFLSCSTVFIKNTDKETQFKIFKRILNDANQSRTARSIIRLAIQSGDEFHYDFGKTLAKRDENGTPVSGRVGGYNSALGFNDRILIDSVLANSLEKKDRIETVSTFVHETFHDLQDRSSMFTDKFLIDAETQAISAQVTYELDQKDKNYGEFYIKNYNKWLKYAKTGKIPPDAPKDFLQFKPVDGLSPQELKEAQKQYASQMASQETQAKYIHDYASIPAINKLRKKENLQVIKNAGDEGLKYWFGQALLVLDGKIESDEDLIDEIMDRNPFLKQEDFNSLRAIYKSPLKYSKEEKSEHTANLGNTLSQNAQQNITSQPADIQRPFNSQNKDRTT